MTKAEKDILTTADTAKLLGVSIRTAQLLIEGGSIASWKTPGGHRRVYRSDVMAIIEGKARSVDRPLSAMVVVVCVSERFAAYKHAFAQIGECTVQVFEDVLAAVMVVGSLKPHAIIVDMDGSVDRMPLLRSLAANSALGHTLILAAGSNDDLATELQTRVVHAHTPEDARDAVRKSMHDGDDSPLQASDFPFPIARNERQRLVALERAGLLDTAPEEAFDRLTWLAAESLQAPIALMTLLTPTRQWFKSRVGLDLPETPRSWAFCNHTILQKDVFSIEDLACDPRFSDNPAVAGDPKFRFYAGASVIDENGFVVGSLCVIDYKARQLDTRGAQIIQALAALASDEVRLRALERRVNDARLESGHTSTKRLSTAHAS